MAETVVITLLYARAKSVFEYNQAQILLFRLYQWLKNQMDIRVEVINKQFREILDCHASCLSVK